MVRFLAPLAAMSLACATAAPRGAQDGGRTASGVAQIYSVCEQAPADVPSLVSTFPDARLIETAPVANRHEVGRVDTLRRYRVGTVTYTYWRGGIPEDRREFMIRAVLVPPWPPGVRLPAPAAEPDLQAYLGDALRREARRDTTTLLWELVPGERGIDPEVYVRAVLVGDSVVQLECIPYFD